jgi:plastocyanin
MVRTLDFVLALSRRNAALRHWPDTATIDVGDDVDFTSSNLIQHFAAAVKLGDERFEFWRLRLRSK